MLDIYFPVNTIYGTFDSTFDPNTAWGGTWVKITDGRVLVPSATPNVTGGSSTSGSHTLTTSESGQKSYNQYRDGYYVVRRYYTNSALTTLWGGSGYYRDIQVASATPLNDGGNQLFIKTTGSSATSGHTHPDINPLNRSYCLWYRTA